MSLPESDTFKRTPKLNKYSPYSIVNLDSLEHMFNDLKFIQENGIRLVEFKEGTILNKAMQIRFNDSIDQTNIENVFASRASWFTNLIVSRKYSKLGFGDVNSFKVKKNLKLFDISSHSNWELLWSKLNKKLNSLIEFKYSANISHLAKNLHKKEIKKIKLEKKVIKLAVGFDVTWFQQRKLLIELGNVITNDFSYDPYVELEKRNSNPYDWFSNENNEPCVIKVMEDTFGWRKNDLNRVSFTKDLDNIMIETITQHYNVDGYYSGRFPSLFHFNGALETEIALSVPRDCLTHMNLSSNKSIQFNRTSIDRSISCVN